ncbi:MAG: anaerobic ribonucleoside-triphosphate reductase activating protein [Oscillospiraceae bacterium]|nr:anaerobic ribonucleoside-triphosphate reductase activating protein [Oscillospiraceae bacterium]
MQIKIAGIVKNSVVDGPGIRYTIFSQGCSFKCENCHNPHTHDFEGGEWRNIEDLASEIKSDPLLDGVTFSGGEPFEQAQAFIDLANLIPEYHIICYTGYTFEELLAGKAAELLNKINILVDGQFVQSRRDYKIRFKGSANQRVIDSKESIKHGKVIETSL